MAPFFANRSCDPFTARDIPCRYGNYVRYAVNVTGSNDIIATIAFAKKYNIRFIIRNTGHDYLGRSTGAGSLSVWTHHLKDIEFIDWNDANFTGTAMKIGAGVQGYEALDAGNNRSVVTVGGECPTVGIAGGYSQGGGHSALSTSFGLSADNILQWEVVTANGELITASRTENTDLYWALTGGGAGNYAVVVSAIIKTHPDSYVGGGTVSFTTDGISNDTFYEAVNEFHAALTAMVDAGTMVLYFLTSSVSFTTQYSLKRTESNKLQSFKISPITAFNKTESEVQSILAPYLATLDSIGINYTASFTQSASYYDHFETYLGPLPVGFVAVGVAQYGGRLIPRSTVQENTANFTDTVRFIIEQGADFTGVGLNVSRFATYDQNGVVPAWREAIMHAVTFTPWSFDPADWDEMIARQYLMTDTIMPALEAITPGSGAYLNEGDFRQPDFQTAFFGDKYDTLLSIKEKYDPDKFFYAIKAVGSESWTVSEDGHMCRTS